MKSALYLVTNDNYGNKIAHKELLLVLFYVGECVIVMIDITEHLVKVTINTNSPNPSLWYNG